METNKDRMLRKVLQNEALVKSYEYNPEDYPDVSSALASSNAVVTTIATIVDDMKDTEAITKKNLYTKIFNYLNTNLH